MKIMQNVDYNGIRCESKEQMKNQTVFDDDARAESNLATHVIYRVASVI